MFDIQTLLSLSWGQFVYPALLVLTVVLLYFVFRFVVPCLVRCMTEEHMRTAQEKRIQEIREIGYQSRREMQRIYDEYLLLLARQGRF